MIKDSGTRRTFETGAKRDIQEGKGRCDLMPLDIIESLFSLTENYLTNNVLLSIAYFIKNGDISDLHNALNDFLDYTYGTDMTGVVTVILDLSKHFEDGAKKYGERNWEKGIPVHSFIDSALRHYLKFLRGDEDENHKISFVWNIVCCLWTLQHKPEMNDLKGVEINERNIV